MAQMLRINFIIPHPPFQDPKAHYRLFLRALIASRQYPFPILIRQNPISSPKVSSDDATSSSFFNKIRTNPKFLASTSENIGRCCDDFCAQENLSIKLHNLGKIIFGQKGLYLWGFVP
jgi:hypothetical protein